MAPLWADVPADILGSVLGLLLCHADRASVRSVCRHWRAAVRVQALPPPLPVLLLPRFRFSCLTSDGMLTAARQGPVPVELVGDGVRIVGSFDDWLVAVRTSRDVNRNTDEGECFLANAFSSEVIHLPHMQSPSNYSCLDVLSSSARPVQGSFLGTSKRQRLWLCHSAVSASPGSVSNYTVAALSYNTTARFLGLALWQPGMTSWYHCRSDGINFSSDGLVFYQGKLYVVCRKRPKTTAFELREDEHGVSLSCPKEYTIDPHPLIPSKRSFWRRYNMVVWRGKLLLVIRFFSHYTYRMMERKPNNVEVFALDLSTSPCGFTQIHNFDGDCIFVAPYGCRSFSPGLQIGVQGDLIYFSDGCIDKDFLVYNMRDGTVRPFVAGLPLDNSWVPEERYIGLPIWLFPS